MKAADKIFLLLALLALVPLAAGCAELKTQWDKITGNEEEEAPPAAPSILYISPAESPTSG
ncbi:MAG: hypothetical protein MUC63_07110, partial [Planctomycetes bacterium]|nr:hypothetical protein [Planctomycetota bacterium]